VPHAVQAARLAAANHERLAAISANHQSQFARAAQLPRFQGVQQHVTAGARLSPLLQLQRSSALLGNGAASAMPIATGTPSVLSSSSITPVAAAPAATSPLAASPTVTVPTTPTANATQDATTPTDIIPKAGSALSALYEAYLAYVQGGSQGTFSSSQAANLEVVGTSVDIDVRGTGDVGVFAQDLSSFGMQILAVDTNTETVEGLLPIGQLPIVASLPQTVSINPVYKPALNAGFA
jgi:hypothetical protein